MNAIISVVSKFVSEYERPNVHGVRSLITSSIPFPFLVTYVKLYITVSENWEDNGAAAKLFMTFCIPRLALPKNICLKLMRILSIIRRRRSEAGADPTFEGIVSL